jgi:hypothetical protein
MAVSGKNGGSGSSVGESSGAVDDLAPANGTCVRRRTCVSIALAVTVLVGLSSRMFHFPLPRLIQKEFGDVLWAMAAYWAIALIAPRCSIVRVAILSTVLAVASEMSQLSKVPWLEAGRDYGLGRLLLGSGFSWLDVAMYPVGAAAAYLIDRYLMHPQKRNHPET